MKRKYIKACVELTKNRDNINKIFYLVDKVSQIEKIFNKAYFKGKPDIEGKLTVVLQTYNYSENIWDFFSVYVTIELTRHNPTTLIFEDFSFNVEKGRFSRVKPFRYELLRFLDNCHLSVDKKEAKQIILNNLKQLWDGHK